MIKELDDERFQVRENAARELEQLGELAEGPLQRVLRGAPSLEQRRRVERLLEKLGTGPVASTGDAGFAGPADRIDLDGGGAGGL